MNKFIIMFSILLTFISLSCNRIETKLDKEEVKETFVSGEFNKFNHRVFDILNPKNPGGNIPHQISFQDNDKDGVIYNYIKEGIEDGEFAESMVNYMIDDIIFVFSDTDIRKIPKDIAFMLINKMLSEYPPVIIGDIFVGNDNGYLVYDVQYAYDTGERDINGEVQVALAQIKFLIYGDLIVALR